MNAEFGTLDEETAEALATAEKSSTSSATPKVVGKGIYLELRNNTDTTQLLITPAGLDDKGKYVETAFIYRTVSEYSPRRQWRVMFIKPSKDKTGVENTSLMSNELIGHLNRYATWGGKLVNETPIVFEVSNIDLSEVAEWKAPAPALRRIAKARTEVGFPTELYEVSK